VHGVIGLGGLQGTAACTAVMRALPYGLPKVMVSTVASGDTSPYVGISDITMMFSVGDILGLNAFMRKVLANAAGAAHGMAQVTVALQPARGEGGEAAHRHLQPRRAHAGNDPRPRALPPARLRGHRVPRGRHRRPRDGADDAQGIIGAVFDYAMGEISDELFHGLRAGGPERLTVAGTLGLPQVLCPGGAEHLGILVSTPHVLPDRWKHHAHVWHNEVVLAPRLNTA
jgi:uncharacterized protein (UPF0261 family)